MRPLPTISAMMLFAATVAACRDEPKTASTAQAVADSVTEACAAGDTATRWRQVQRAWETGEGERETDPSLRARLLRLKARDQAMRTIPGAVDSMNDPAFQHRMMARDSANAAELMEIVRRHGWPTRRMVGPEAASAAWLVAQHNPHIQHEALRLMQALPPGEVSPSDLAKLEDRIRTLEGLPQRYGSQLVVSNDGRTQRFVPIEDLPGLEERRARAGLPPLAVSMCIMRTTSGVAVIPPSATDTVELPWAKRG